MARSLHDEEFRAIGQARPESGSKDSEMPQELLSFFRLNEKREKTHLRMYRTAIASILEVPGTYSGNFIPGMVFEIRLMIPARGKKSRGGRDLAARNLRRIRISRLRRIYDRPIFSGFFFLSYSRLSIKIFKDKNPRSSNDISRKRHFAIKRVQVLPGGYAHGI